jgi:hypothetical protein
MKGLKELLEKTYKEPTPTEIGTLVGLQKKDTLYYGSANENQVAKRHAKNKVAKRSRKRNRG